MILQKRKRKTTTAEPKWASLPKHILDDILDRLVNVHDYIQFGAVCLPWRSVALDDRNYRGNQRRGIDNNTRFSDHQLPLLKLPHCRKNAASFYSAADQKELEFELPAPYSKRFIGSSLGWLISVDTDFSITLFNPFCGATPVRLPPVISPTLMTYDVGLRNFDPARFDSYILNHEYYLVKAVLSADPGLHPDDYVVMVIYGTRGMMAHIRPGARGDNEWVHYHPLKFNGFCDIIYSQSSGLFYALHVSGRIFWIIACDEDEKEDVHVDFFPPTLETDRPCNLRYIVESCRGGDLLQVLRFRECGPLQSSNYTSGLKVFKLDKSTPIWYWVELKSLGDEVLFLGDSSSLSVMASDFPGLAPGSIHFLLPFDRELLVRKKPFFSYSPYSAPYDMFSPYSSPYDMTVGNINGEYYQPHHIRDEYYSAIPDRPPIWVVPTFQEAGVNKVNKKREYISSYGGFPSPVLCFVVDCVYPKNSKNTILLASMLDKA